MEEMILLTSIDVNTQQTKQNAVKTSLIMLQDAKFDERIAIKVLDNLIGAKLIRQEEDYLVLTAKGKKELEVSLKKYQSILLEMNEIF